MRRLSLRSLLVLALLVSSAALAYAQLGGSGAATSRPKQEYLHQEVQADEIVKTLNDLDGQGWDLFQIVPVWKFNNDNGNATLEAKSYQVFGRRPLKK
jgi:hypothetical protein